MACEGYGAPNADCSSTERRAESYAIARMPDALYPANSPAEVSVPMVKNYVWLCALASLLCVHGASAEDVDGRTVATAMLDARSELRSGQVDISFRRWYAAAELKGAYSVAFDTSKQSVRIKTTLRDEASWVLDNGSNRFFFTEGTRTLAKTRTQAELPDREQEPLDIRCVGIVNSGEWDRRRTIESMRDFLLGTDIDMSVRDDSSIVAEGVLLEWRRVPNKGTGEYWMRHAVLDARRGMAPLRVLEGMARNLDDDPRGRDAKRTATRQFNVEYSAEFDWIIVNNALVPAKWSFEEFSGMQGGEYIFNWTSANAPLDDVVFSVEGLPLLPKTIVINEELDEPFIEEILVGAP